MNQVLKVFNPYTEKQYVEVELQSKESLDKALAESERARFEWQEQTDLEKRIAFCEKALEYIKQNKSDIGLEITRQMGKPLSQALGEVDGSIFRAEHLLAKAQDALSPVYPYDDKNRFIKRFPLGTVLAVAAWNYPMMIAVNVIIPALLSGNSVLMKHSEITPLCGLRWQKAFEAAGVPVGLLQNIVCNHNETAYLCASDKVHGVFFTGSNFGGEAVKKACAGKIIPLGLELGGKDPAFVRADCDFDFAVPNLVEGNLYNAGQSCCAIERIYIEDDIYDSFVEAFAEATKLWKQGNPEDSSFQIGPQARPSAPGFLSSQVKDALSKGAKLVYQGEKAPSNSGYFAGVSVLSNVNHSMAIMNHESFGPIIGLQRVKDEVEALSLMNDSYLGLTASVWTSDHGFADSFSEKLEAGTVFQNRCDYLDPLLPWTGWKGSGLGSSLSYLGFYNVTKPKSFNLRRETKN